jgi:chaperone LolA
MTMNAKGVGAVVALIMLASWCAPAGETAEEVLSKVRKKYDGILDAEVKFTQTVKFSVAKIEQKLTGTLLVKKENMYRVEVEGLTIVTDGRTVWSYSTATNQVLVDNFKLHESVLSPERILMSAPEDFSPVLLGKEKGKKTSLIVLKLMPRDEESFVSSLKLWVDEGDWLIKKAELTDINGKETTYTVDAFRMNVGLRDARFVFEVPAGVEVVDLR